MPLPKPVIYADDAENPNRPRKPKAILHAEWVLWVWTAWTCLYGIMHSWLQLPEVERMITTETQGYITISHDELLKCIFVIYAAVGITSAWVVWGIAKGKTWGPKSAAIGFVCEIISECFSSHSLMDYLAAIPDYGMQVYALYLLYSSPGRQWFARDK